jgi:transposase
MTEKRRRTYTAAFKAKVGLEAIRGVQTTNEIAQAYGVHPVQVGHWKRRLLSRPGHCLKPSGDAKNATKPLNRTDYTRKLAG